jgi:GT2 family glycosyltransferase
MTMMTPPRVAVVLVNYQANQATQQCLQSLAMLDYPPALLDIWVVDNGGHDWATLAAITTAGPFAVTPIQVVPNQGYSAGNNAAIRQALQAPVDAVWLLNNDTQVMPETLQALVSQWQTHQADCLVGGVLYYPDGQFQQVATRINLWTGSSKGYTLHDALSCAQVDSLSGACMLIPRSVLDRIGLLPEAYFLYFEDVAFCLAAKQQGIPCVISPVATVRHSMGYCTNAIPQQRSYYYDRNRWQVCWRFGHPAQRASLVAYGVYRVLRSKVKALLNPALRGAHAVLRLALNDALTGVTGPCPYPHLK